MWGGPEPDLDRLMAAVEERGGAGAFAEIIWCGFGEPTFMLDLITEASPILRRAGAQVRLNTNGHACLIHGRDVMAELARAVDTVSVSLNAPSGERYIALCRPEAADLDRKDELEPETFWKVVVHFLSRASHFPWQVQASVVGDVLTDAEIVACRKFTASIDDIELRVR